MEWIPRWRASTPLPNVTAFPRATTHEILGGRAEERHHADVAQARGHSSREQRHEYRLECPLQQAQQPQHGAIRVAV